MATLLSRLFVELGLKSDNLDRDIDKSKGKLTKGLAGVMKSVGTTAGGFLAAQIVGNLVSGVKSQAGAVVSAASDMNETVSKVNAVFGSGADDILKWGGNAEATLGIADGAALGAAASIGNLFKGVGVASDELGTMSKATIQAATDLGSFNNIPTDQVLADIESGLVGEAEPLRKYGILINEAGVQAKGMALGLADANGELSEGAKVQARYALILEQLGDAQGDFAKTSGGYANARRTLEAYGQSVRVWLGQLALPYIERVINGINRWIKTFQSFRSKGMTIWMSAINALQKSLTTVFGATRATMITGFILDMVDHLRDLGRTVRQLIPVFWEILKAGGQFLAWIAKSNVRMYLAFGVIGLVIKNFRFLWRAVMSLLKPFGSIVKWFRLFKLDGLNPVSAGLKALGTVFEHFKSSSAPLQRIVRDIGHAMAYLAQAVHDFLSGNPDKGVKHLGDAFGFLWDAIKTVFNSIPWATIGQGIWTAVQNVFAAIPWGVIAGLVWEGVKAAWIAIPWTVLWDQFKETFNQLDAWLQGTAYPPIVAKFKDLWNQLDAWLQGTAYPAIIQATKDGFNQLDRWLQGTAYPAIIQAFQDAFNQLDRWLQGTLYPAIIATFVDTFNRLDAWLQGTAYPAMFDVGRNIVSGIWTGIASLGGWLLAQVGNFIQEKIVNAVKGKLGIDSPSRVMAEQGRYTVLGFALGVRKHATVAAAAVGAMARNAAAAGGVRPIGVGTAASAATGGSGLMSGGGMIRDIKIIIDGAGDPEVVAQKVASVLMRQVAIVQAGAV